MVNATEREWMMWLPQGHTNLVQAHPPLSVIRWFFDAGALRPHLKEFFTYLLSLKRQKKIGNPKI